MTFALRPYQTAAIAAVEQSMRGPASGVICLPTGTGKTVVFAELIARNPDRKWLVLAHRGELLTQAQNKIKAAAPSLAVEIEQAGQRASRSADVVIATVQTMRGKRLSSWRGAGFGGCIIDECHHAPAASYRAIIDYFGFGYTCGRYLLGVTATPERGDRVGLDNVFGELLYNYTVAEAIRDGYLVEPVGYAVDTSFVNLDSVQTKCGDFVASQLSGVINTRDRNTVIVQSYLKLAADKRAIVFAVDVAHAEDLRDEFERAGLRAAVVTGRTDKSARRAILAGFDAGQLDVLCNCAVLTEGYDSPGIECVIMARPTQSAALYRQCVGRGLRPSPGKETCVVIDFADNSRHGLIGLGSLCGQPLHKVRDGALVTESSEEYAVVEAERQERERLAARTRRVDLMRSNLPSVLEIGPANYGWQRYRDGDRYRLDGGACVLYVTPTKSGDWCLTVSRPGGLTRHFFGTAAQAVAAGEEHVAGDWELSRAMASRLLM